MHGRLELLLPQPWYEGVEHHGYGRRGLPGLEERRVRREEHVPRQAASTCLSSASGVTTSCTTVGSAVVALAGRTLPLQRRARPARGSCRTSTRALRQPSSFNEARAVRAADGVRAGEHDELATNRRWQELERLAGQGHPPVAAPRGHREVGPATAKDGAGVAAGEGDDVGARDLARASGL